MSEKQEFRNIYKTLRSGMSRRDMEPMSARICANILDSSLYRDAQYIYAYYPLENEADVRLVAQTAWQEGKRVAFPKVFGDEMRFFEVTGFGQLAEGSYGIMEPMESAGAVGVDWMKEDEVPSGTAFGRSPGSSLLVLVPGVAFDRKGNRLGRGKGYYDRYFEKLTGLHDGAPYNNMRGASVDTPRRVTLLGVAYTCQIANRLPAQKHDLTVTYLASEEGIISSDQSCG